MKNVYDEFMERVQQGQRFKINLNTQTLKAGNKVLIENGKIADEFSAIEFTNPLETIENLYGNYIASMPSLRSDRRKVCFYAPSADEMELEDLVFGEEREIARARLEGYVVCLAASGFKWSDDMGSWFWKSPNFPNLILLKEWFQNRDYMGCLLT